MASTQKKVVVRSFAGVTTAAYAPQSGFLHAGSASVMLVDGRLAEFPLATLKHIAYVRDFNLQDQADPERLVRRSFTGRPRGEGLWLRIHFIDDDTMEGLTDVSLVLLDSLIEDRGIFLTPPDTRGNTQRLFVPRTSMRSLDVLGYVTSPSRKLAQLSEPKPLAQARLFAGRGE